MNNSARVTIKLYKIIAKQYLSDSITNRFFIYIEKREHSMENSVFYKYKNNH